MKRALNHMTTPRLGYTAFLDLAADLGCIGVEVRNDLERPLFDGVDPVEAGEMARQRGLRIVGLSQVQPFNDWSEARAEEVRALIATARAAGAETISLIPRNDGTGVGNGDRQARLRVALKAILPMLEAADMTALVEPLGFARSSLRFKEELVQTIEALGATGRCKLVHDTFHHALAGGGPLFPDHTGIVHVSGVVDPGLDVGSMEDAHRVLVDEEDRLDNLAQLRALFAAGYDGPVSMECFAPETHAIAAPRAPIARSFEYMTSQLGTVTA